MRGNRQFAGETMEFGDFVVNVKMTHGGGQESALL